VISVANSPRTSGITSNANNSNEKLRLDENCVNRKNISFETYKDTGKNSVRIVQNSIRKKPKPCQNTTLLSFFKPIVKRKEEENVNSFSKRDIKFRDSQVEEEILSFDSDVVGE